VVDLITVLLLARLLHRSRARLFRNFVPVANSIASLQPLLKMIESLANDANDEIGPPSKLCMNIYDFMFFVNRYFANFFFIF